MSRTADMLLQKELGLTDEEVRSLNNRSVTLAHVAEVAQLYKEAEQEHERLTATRAEQRTEQALQVIRRGEIQMKVAYLMSVARLFATIGLCFALGGAVAFIVISAFRGLS